ncbi:MAG: dienelactone hydrolase family protein [Microbacteriaceae bacterium]|nr:dienelactone hydrolase family protein [Burkholderiaceae bacterium]
MTHRALRWLRGLGLSLWLLAGAGLQAQTVVDVPSLDTTEGRPLMLKAHWFAAPDSGDRPTLLLLHGCGGPHGRQGGLSERMRDYAALLNAEGWHALVLDSFSIRGVQQICTQKMATRTITQVQRRLDTLGALQWLAAQPGVDGARLALLGWSNGGSAVLAATNLRHPAVAAAAVRPLAAVAFYPGCEAEKTRGYRPSTALLMQVGAADDWTPAAPCEALAREAAPPQPQIDVYPGAHHGFDSAAPVRHWAEVPNGVQRGAGVHLGGQPEARAASREAVLQFLRTALR